MTENKSDMLGFRILSMLIDHVIMTIVFAFFCIPMFVSLFVSIIRDNDMPEPSPMSGPWFYIGIFGFALYFCKDCIKGRSPAKHILKFQVLNNKTGRVASPPRCVVRNLFCAFWPVEVVATLVNPDRRIGDFVAGTRVARYEPAAVEQPRVNVAQLILSIVVAFGFCLLIASPALLLQSAFKAPNFDRASYNATASKAIEKLYSDSLGGYLNAEVRVYDKVEGSSLKYVSIVFNLKDNYLSSDENEEYIQDLTLPYLYSVYPKNSFTGRAKYVFSKKGYYRGLSRQIGKSGR